LNGAASLQKEKTTIWDGMAQTGIFLQKRCSTMNTMGILGKLRNAE
jgi:hypothetical protein